MPQTVTLPDGSTVDFPDGMAPAEIQGVLDQQFGQPSPEQKAKAISVAFPGQSQAFNPSQFGTDWQSARKAIDALPEDQRKQAVQNYARHFVTEERKDGGIGQALTDHIRMAARNVPYVGEFADELNAYTSSLFGGDYELTHAAEQERRRQIDAEDRAGVNIPYVGEVDTGDIAKGAGLVGGAVAAPGVVVSKAPGVLGAGTNAAATTGVAVTADVAGQAEGTAQERLAEGLEAGAKAAPFGFAAGALGQKVIDKAFKGKPVYAEGRTVEELREAGQRAYKAADDAGVIFSDSATQRLFGNIKKDLAEAGYHPRLQPKVAALIDEAERLANSGNVTLKGLDQFRKMAGAVRGSVEPSERMFASKITERIDDIFMNPQKSDVLTGQIEKASKAMVEGRKTWLTMRKSEAVSEAMQKAQDRTMSTGSGGNIENALRQEFKKLITNKKTARMFKDGEKADIRAFVAGSMSQNLLRRIGRLSPEGNGLMLMLHTMGGVASSGSTLPAMLLGFGAKRMADGGAARTAERLQQAISGGGQIGTRFSTWQKIVKSGATPATKRLATQTFARQLTDETGEDPQVVEQTLWEAANSAEGPDG